MFGPCKVCAEKDLRIADLQKQVDLLHTLVFPVKQNSEQAFLTSLEANKILGGETDQVDISEDESVLLEADSILNGNYDEHVDYM